MSLDDPFPEIEKEIHIPTNWESNIKELTKIITELYEKLKGLTLSDEIEKRIIQIVRKNRTAGFQDLQNECVESILDEWCKRNTTFDQELNGIILNL